jgi:ribonuclease J
MGEVGDEVLRDRRHLAGDGLVVVVVAINSKTGTLERPPELIARGMASAPQQDDLLRDAPGLLETALAGALQEERTDPGLMKERIRLEVQRMFRKRANRRPMVLPVVMEM